MEKRRLFRAACREFRVSAKGIEVYVGTTAAPAGGKFFPDGRVNRLDTSFSECSGGFIGGSARLEILSFC